MAVVNDAFLSLCRMRGVDVVELPGWKSRGESGRFAVQGVLLHHDAMGLHNDNVPQYMSQNGNDGSQLWIKYTGQLYVLAAGLKWHAGAGRGFRSIPANGGNAYCVGIETDYSGVGPRPFAIDASIHVVTGCLVDYYQLDPQRDLALHKEYAPDRKIDLSNFDADAWRDKASQGLSLGGSPAKPQPPVQITDEDILMANIDDLVNEQKETNRLLRASIEQQVADQKRQQDQTNNLAGIVEQLAAFNVRLDKGAAPKA